MVISLCQGSFSLETFQHEKPIRVTKEPCHMSLNEERRKNKQTVKNKIVERKEKKEKKRMRERKKEPK